MRTILHCINLVPTCFIGAAMVFGPCGATPPAHAQGYVPASRGDAAVEYSREFYLNFGQRCDLQILFDHEFNTEPCPAPSTSQVMKTCTITITLDWMPSDVPPLAPFEQVEHPRNCDSQDQLVFFWEEPRHWVLDSAKLDGENVPTRGDNPAGELFGNVINNGARMMIPMHFENGEVDDPITYTFVLKYLPGEECKVEPLVVGGHYIHTFRGQWHVAITPELIIGTTERGIPSLTPAPGDTDYDWGWSSDAWQKPIFNAETLYDSDNAPPWWHRKHLELPENCVPRPGCCGDEPDDTPTPPAVMIQYVDNSDPDDATVMATVQPTEGPLTSVSITGWTQDHIQIAQHLHVFEEPSWQTETFEVTCRLPAGCNTDSLYFVATGRGLNSGSTSQGLSVNNSGPRLPRFLDAESIIDSRLVAPSILVAEIPHPEVEVPSISDLNHVFVADQLQQVVDEEAPFKIIDNGSSHTLYYHVVESASRTFNNGVLEVLNHDFVQLFSQTSAEWDIIGIPVVSDDHPEAMNIFGTEGIDMHALQILGTATGGTFELDFCEGDHPVIFTTTLGATPEETASQMVDAINAMEFTTVTAELHEPDQVRFIADLLDVHFLMVDGGIDLRCVATSDPGRPADFDDNGVVNGADLGLFLNAMASPPSDVGPFDLTGDGQIDAADLGMVLADWG